MAILFVVATPIGNLTDVSERVTSILGSVDVIAAEDTRRTGQLLKNLGITNRLIPLHDHNEDQSSLELLQLLQNGQSVAVVSDAGTPLISDPGYDLVKHCHAAGIQVVPVPGPSSLTTALSVAGIATNRFTFEGFVPAKAKARMNYYRGLSSEARTIVMFETPHRIEGSLRALSEVMGGDRLVTVCRELTKTFEQIVHGSVDEVLGMLAEGKVPAKGEFVLVVAGSEDSPVGDADQLLLALLTELSPSRAAAVAAKLTGSVKSELYDRALKLKVQLESD